jgi:lysophospholipase L1-like esterase
MKLFERRLLVNSLLIASALLNLAMLGYLSYSGNIRRVFIRMNMVDVPPDRAESQVLTEARYRSLPSRPGEVVFAGDSLVAAGPWADFYAAIHNRGIVGETTRGLLQRLDEITEDRPRKLFLLIGSNDLSAAVPPSRLIANYRTILERIAAESPTTETVAIGVLPVNKTVPGGGPYYTNTEVQEVNRRLKALVAEFPRARFEDVTDLLTDESGNLRPGYTSDGLHLTVEGYLALRERLEGPVLQSDPRKPPQESATP